MCIHDDVSTRIKESTLPANGLKFLWRNQVGTGTGIPCELRHAHATVEIRDGTDDGFAFCLRLRELDGIRKLTIGNINSGFHIPRIAIIGIPVKSLDIPHSCILASPIRHGRSAPCLAIRCLCLVPPPNLETRETLRLEKAET